MWYYFQKLIQIQRKNTLAILIKVRKIFAHDIFRKWLYLKMLLSENFRFPRNTHKTRKQRFSQLETQNIHFWKIYTFSIFLLKSLLVLKKELLICETSYDSEGGTLTKWKFRKKKTHRAEKSWKKVFSAIIRKIHSSVPQDQKFL